MAAARCPGAEREALGREGDRAGEHLVEQAAEAVDIGARIRRGIVEQLRRGVLDAADQRGEVLAAHRAAARGESEAGQVDPVALEQDVRGFEVPVEEPDAVRGPERGGDPAEDAHGLRHLESPPLGDQFTEVGTVDPAHRGEEGAVGFVDLVDRDHARVVDRPGDPHLAPELLAQVLVGGELGPDDLHRDDSLEARLQRLVDLPRPSFADELEELVAGDAIPYLEVAHQTPAPS